MIHVHYNKKDWFEGIFSYLKNFNNDINNKERKMILAIK